MIVNTKDTPHGLLVIVCDSDLIGKKFEEGDKQLDLTVAFYEGKEMEPQMVADLMRNAEHIHLVGAESVALAQEEGLVEDEHILYVDSIPHAEVTRA